MNTSSLAGKLRNFVLVSALALAPVAAHAGIFISVGFAPPALPVYTQPLCPGDGYLWTPGYWGYSPEGYYWVPGVWVEPPTVGFLWTPAYWGWEGGVYRFHDGYWGSHVGFYGGINYGFGYGGVGFGGGRWEGGHFAYNTAVMNVNRTSIHNTYVDRTVINNVNVGNHTSFNGGQGGIQARPTAQENSFSHENHVAPTAMQQSHFQAAQSNRANFASANGGHPAMAAMARPGANNTAVAARGAQPAAANHGGTQTGGFGHNAQPAMNNRAAQPAAANRGNVQQESRAQASTQARSNPIPRSQTSGTQFHPATQSRTAPQQQSHAAAPQSHAAPQQHAAPQSHPQGHGPKALTKAAITEEAGAKSTGLFTSSSIPNDSPRDSDRARITHLPSKFESHLNCSNQDK